LSEKRCFDQRTLQGDEGGMQINNKLISQSVSNITISAI